MTDKKFTSEEAIRYGWNTFKSHIPLFLGFAVVSLILSFGLNYAASKIFSPNSLGLICANLVNQVISVVFYLACIRLTLDIHDTGSPDLGNIPSVFAILPTAIVSYILMVIIFMIGFILLIIPGFIALLALFFVLHLIVDRRLGPIEALKASYEITRGHKFDLFVFLFLLGAVNVVGLICLGVGLLVTLPMTWLATAYVYRRLSPLQPV